MGGEKSTPARDGSGPMNPASHSPAVRHVNISGIVGCQTGNTSTPICAPSMRAISRKMIPVETALSSPVRKSFVYKECRPEFCLPFYWNLGVRSEARCVWANAIERFPDHELGEKLRSEFPQEFSTTRGQPDLSVGSPHKDQPPFHAGVCLKETAFQSRCNPCTRY